MEQESIFDQRIRIADEAVAHQEPERIPIWINFGSTPMLLDQDQRSTYKDMFYDHARAKEVIVRFHEEFQPDVQLGNLHCGPAEELAGTKYIDWPGRPGTRVPDHSIFQVSEYEFLEDDEYDELLGDFTGFMLHKYLPRAFPGLEGLSAVLNPAPTGYMNVASLRNLFQPKAMEAYRKLLDIGKQVAETEADIADLQKTLSMKGFPPMFTGVGMVPYDILANYFRGTMGIFADLIEDTGKVEEAVDRFADIQIANAQYFRFAPLPVKRMMFWMHKGMDGFMSPEQYETLYWKPYLKVINALVDMGVTPIIYTEGKYETRLEQMTGLPPGKCVIHFEKIDLQRAKSILGKDHCITGNFPIYLLEHGTKQQVIDEAKRQIDIGAPGGGFIFETDASIENVKRENLHALYDTVREYGRK